MNFYRKIQPNKISEEYINIWNGVLQLSKREAEVFSILLTYQLIYGNIEGVRSIVMDKLNISNPNYSKYISTLRNKNLIIKKDDKYIIHPRFVPNVVHLKEDNKSVIELLFTLEIEKENEEFDKILSYKMEENDNS